jgi:phosphatidylglycerophosphatase A
MNTFKTAVSRITHWCAIGFGSGLSPWMPGTAGSAIGLLIAIGINYNLSTSYSLAISIAIALAFSLLGISICNHAAKKLDGDHPSIVWDEISGIYIAVIALPLTWQWYLAGFLLFRLLDILKPFPIGWLDQNLKGGLGIMCDDLVAGLCVCLILHSVNLWTKTSHFLSFF